MKRPCESERYRNIKELYLQGFSPSQIAEKLGLSRNIIGVCIFNMRKSGDITTYFRETNKRDRKRHLLEGEVEIPCMCCGRPFPSPDKKRVRLCRSCKDRDNYMPECAFAEMRR